MVGFVFLLRMSKALTRRLSQAPASAVRNDSRCPDEDWRSTSSSCQMFRVKSAGARAETPRQLPSMTRTTM